MLTVAERVARSGRDFGYVLFLESVPWAFTDRDELCGSGGFSWVGVANGEREVLPGLEVPETMTTSTNLETGMLEGDDGLTFTVIDFDRRLIAYIRNLDDEAETVGVRLSPKDDPAPSTLLSSDGQTNISIHGKWVGHEAIGSSGERRMFQLFPGVPGSFFGYDHAALSSDVQDIGASQVFEEPTHFVGRKVALYRIFRDVTTAGSTYPYWASMADSFSSGYGLVWTGTIDQMSAEGTTWKIKCNGPSSLLCRPLNVNRPSTWQKVSTPLFLKTTPGERQDLMAISCHYIGVTTGTILMGGYSIFDTTNDVLPTTGLLSDILSAIQTRLATIVATPGADVTWTVDHLAKASFMLGYATVQINDAAGYVGAWDLCLHELIWKSMGFEPQIQKKDGAYGKYNIDFRPANPDGQVPLGEGWWTAPGPGYWVARFTTIPVGFSDRTDAVDEADNDNKIRSWIAINDPGVSLVFPGGQQELDVGIGTATPYIETQLNRPPDEHTFTDSGGDTDSTGYFALRGQYRTSIDEDPIEMVQVFKGSWRNDDNTYGSNSQSVRQLYISRFLDPRWFGIDRKPLNRVWAVAKGELEMLPFSIIGYNLDYGDRADLVLLRLLLSTGTAEWTGFEGNASRALGDNEDPDAAHDEGNDTDCADLGLGVYHELVDAKSFTDTANELPQGGANSPLNRVKIGVTGATDSQALIQRILEPRGWAMGWSRGQFRLFSRPQPLRFEDATVTLSPDDFASDDLPYVEAVDLTPLTPKDRFKVTYGAPLVDGAGSEDDLVYSVKALDAGARVRHSNADLEIDAQGLIPTELWQGENSPPSWQSAFAELWGRTMATWFASAHVLVQGVPVLYSKGKDIGAGTIVRFSGYFAPSRDGVYGLNNRVGRVTRVVHNTQDLTSKLDILIQPGDPLAYRRFAPIAFVKDEVTTVEDRFNSSTRTLYCYSDYFGHDGEDDHDLRYFSEPSWLGVGGDAKVYGYQWNGLVWSQNFSFDVESVDEANDSITYKAGTFSGTFKDASYTFLTLAPYDQQDVGSWPRALFVVHTDSTFNFGAGPTKGFKLV